MRVTNLKTQRSYTILRAKYQANAAWCSHVKPVTIKLDGIAVKAHALPEKSNYIYFQFKGWAHCVWAKDPKEFDFLKERSLKITDTPKAIGRPGQKGQPISAAKAGVKPERKIKVRKPSGKVIEVEALTDHIRIPVTQ